MSERLYIGIDFGAGDPAFVRGPATVFCAPADTDPDTPITDLRWTLLHPRVPDDPSAAALPDASPPAGADPS